MPKRTTRRVFEKPIWKLVEQQVQEFESDKEGTLDIDAIECELMRRYHGCPDDIHLLIEEIVDTFMKTREIKKFDDKSKKKRKKEDTEGVEQRYQRLLQEYATPTSPTSFDNEAAAMMAKLLMGLKEHVVRRDDLSDENFEEVLIVD